jgi:O-antigen ligase
MASNAAATWRLPAAVNAAARPSDLRLAEVGYVAFLLLIFVTLQPFAVRDVSLLPLGDSGNGQGDVWRQICYLGTFALIAAGAWRRNGARVSAAVPPLLGALLFWCLLSSLWAATPGIAFRRASLEIVIALSALLSMQTLGAERATGLLRNLLGTILIVNWISIPLVHQAVHLSDELDPALIGNWRGLYYHKNIAGAVCAITALLFLFRAIETKKLWSWLMFAAAAGFTLMTRSKTSLGLLPFALFAGVLFRFTRKSTLERWMLVAALVCVAALAGLAAIIDFHSIERFLTDPAELTGRVAIWQAEFAFIRDHPLLGAGFGSFADTGSLSPLYNYVADKWVQGEAHGHNAYIQMCVTIGGTGLLLAMAAFIVQPALAFRRFERREDIALYAPLFALFVFMVLHNFVESDFLEGDGPAWVAFLLMLGALHAREAPRARPAMARSLQWSAP